MISPTTEIVSLPTRIPSMIPTENDSSQGGPQSFQDAVPQPVQSLRPIHSEQTAREIGTAIPENFNANDQDDTAFQNRFSYCQDPVPQLQSASSPKFVSTPSQRDGPTMRIFNANFTDWNDLNQQNNFKYAKNKENAAIEPFLGITERWHEMDLALKNVVVKTFINAFISILRYVSLDLNCISLL